VLAGGDDYELVFCAPAGQRAAVAQASARSATPVSRIGRIEAAMGLRLVDGQGRKVESPCASFDHFSVSSESRA
jgi:thiamine-monophosphate kinase